MNDIKPIQTRYAGYLFRSRLEARWAVYFDALGITWEYEKEGYDLGEAGWYLPDFWLHHRSNTQYANAGYWVEIKGQEPSEQELSKALALAHVGPHVVWMFVGDPGNCYRYIFHPTNQNPVVERYPQPHGIRSAGYIIPIWSAFNPLRPKLGGVQDVVDAINAARSARFEHGENGAR